MGSVQVRKTRRSFCKDDTVQVVVDFTTPKPAAAGATQQKIVIPFGTEGFVHGPAEENPNLLDVEFMTDQHGFVRTNVDLEFIRRV